MDDLHDNSTPQDSDIDLEVTDSTNPMHASVNVGPTEYPDVDFECWPYG